MNCYKNVEDLMSSQTSNLDLDSAAHPLLRIVKAVGENMVNGKYSLMVTLDIEKAFDTTWHLGLLYKMIKFGFSDSIIRSVHSYLSKRRFFVSVDGVNSNQFELSAGVPQGSVVGPVLYVKRRYSVVG